MHRRHFLFASAAAAASLPFAGRLFAAPSPSPRLLVVCLRGGYDSNNLLIPYASDYYYASRPTLAIALPDPANPNSAIALDAQWDLNPRLRDTLQPMWNDKQLAFVPFAGTDDLSRSHFETQDSIEAGQPAGQRSDYRSGFLARLSQVATGTPAIAFTDSLPLSFQGGGDIPNLSLKRNATPAFDSARPPSWRRCIKARAWPAPRTRAWRCASRCRRRCRTKCSRPTAAPPAPAPSPTRLGASPR